MFEISKHQSCYWNSATGWVTKMSLFFFGNNFYKNKETFKIFSPQILEVCRILLVETTLESIMFYHTSSVINTMFVPWTTLLYDSIGATQTLKLSTILLKILVESIWFLFWWCAVLSKDFFHKLCLSGSPSENSQVGWDLEKRMARGYQFDTKWICPILSYAWGIQVFCSRNEVAPHSSNRTLEYLRYNLPWCRLTLRHLNTSGITYHGTD